MLRLLLPIALLAACGSPVTTLEGDGDGVEGPGTGGPRRPGAPADAGPGATPGGDIGTVDRDASGATGDAESPTDTLPGPPDMGPADDAGPPVEPPPAPYGGPPELVRVFPQVAVAEGVIYLEGRRLTAGDGSADRTTVWVETAGGDRIDLTVVAADPVRLTVVTPVDYAIRLVGAGRITVQTPDGVDDSYPVFATTDFSFTGKTSPGEGALGNVYRLRPNTPNLPDFDSPCGGAQPNVIDDATTPCPFTSILATEINIPDREFDTGFPGLGLDLVEWFGIRFAGWMDLPTLGAWEFRVCSDDGSILRLNTDAGLQTVISNDGLHSFRCAEGSVTLTTTPVYYQLDYYQGPRNRIGLQWFWREPGTTEWTIIPAEHLRVFPE
jgi:hypothetical protein